MGRRESARTSRDGSCVAWQRGLVKNWRWAKIVSTLMNERRKGQTRKRKKGKKLTPLTCSCTYEVERVLLCGVTGPKVSHAHLSANLVQLLFQMNRPKYRTPPVVLPDVANMAVKGDHVNRAQTCLMLVASSGERRRGNRPAFSTWDVAKFCASLSRAAPL